MRHIIMTHLIVKALLLFDIIINRISSWRQAAIIFRVNHLEKLTWIIFADIKKPSDGRAADNAMKARRIVWRIVRFQIGAGVK